MNGFDKIEIVRKLEGITSTQKLILLVIATHLGDNEFSFPSISTLQKECCIKKRTAIIKNINELVELEFVIKLPPSNGFKSNRYSINFLQVTSNPRLPVSRKSLVTDGYQLSDPRSLDQSPTVTRLVTHGHPKEIQKQLKKIKTSASRDLSVDNFEKQKQKDDWNRQKSTAQKHVGEIIAKLKGGSGT